MEKTMVQDSALQLAEKNLHQYFKTHDPQYIAEDGVFYDMSSGQRYQGRAEISAVLHYLYQVAFDARAEVVSYIITADKAQADGYFVGKHIGEFADIPATGKAVRVPLCVVYNLQGGLIKEARIYMQTEVLKQQLGFAAAGQRQKTRYLVRDTFYLRFGQYRAAKKLIEKAFEQGLIGGSQQARVLTDFTGDPYRLILEEGFDRLNDYENALTDELKKEDWQIWYELFKPLVERSHREILKQVM
jgi:steroid delta-isomerase-like uncharacterized protein